MNQWMKRLFAVAALCTLAACSSTTTETSDTTAADTADKTEETAKTTDDTASAEESKDTSADTSNTTADASSTTDSTAIATVNEAGTKLQAAFKDQGYTISDLDSEADEYEFHATNDTGTVEVTVNKYYSSDQAMNEYQEETSVFNDEDFYVQDTITCSIGEYSTLRNSINYLWGIVAVDTQNSLVYDIEEIPQANMDSVQSALTEVGFTK